jgi:hypothetical protein
VFLIKKSTGFWILLFFGLLWNVFLFLSCYKYGIGLSVDSANYVSAAENLWKGFGLIQFDGYRYLNAPPFFVWVLLPSFFLGIGPFFWALSLNLICMNLSFFLVVKLAKRALGESCAILGLAFCMIGYWSFTHAFQMLLSESVFISILLLFIIKLEDDIQHAKPLFWSSILLAALCATRYAGLMMIPGVLAILFLSKIKPSRIALFLTPTILFTIIWLIRNYGISGQLFGGHLLKKKLNFAGIITNIENLDVRLKLAFFILILLFVIGFRLKHTWSIVFKLCLFMGSSYWFLLMLQGEINMNQMPRYLSIVEYLGGLVLLELIVFLTPNLNVQNVLWGVLLVFKLSLITEKVETNMGQGAGGFHTNTWQNYTMLGKLKSLEGSNLLSNYPDHIYWARNKNCSYCRFEGEPDQIFLTRIPKEGKIVWFNRVGREHVIANIKQPSHEYSISLIDSCEWFSVYTYSTKTTLDQSTFYK